MIHMMIKMNRKGFTLVEIMIVVAIIGLLAAIAIPNFVRARAKAQAETCIANLRQIEGAVQVWAVDNGQPDTAQATFGTAGNAAPALVHRLKAAYGIASQCMVSYGGGMDFLSAHYGARYLRLAGGSSRCDGGVRTSLNPKNNSQYV